MAHVRYPQFTDASPSAETLAGVGVAPNSVARRRYEQFSEVKSKVETLWSLGVAGAGGSGTGLLLRLHSEGLFVGGFTR